MKLGGLVGSWTEPRGALQLWVPTAGVYVTECVGHMSLPFATQIVEKGQAEFRRLGRLDIFHDWEKLETYDSPARAALTEWGLELLRAQVVVHVFVRSKLVRMGVSVASIALRGILAPHADRPSFEGALAKTLSSATKRTS